MPKCITSFGSIFTESVRPSDSFSDSLSSNLSIITFKFNSEPFVILNEFILVCSIDDIVTSDNGLNEYLSKISLSLLLFSLFNSSFFFEDIFSSLFSLLFSSSLFSFSSFTSLFSSLISLFSSFISLFPSFIISFS